MSFCLLAWRRAFDIKGRSSRKEFWSFIFVHLCIALFVIALDLSGDEPMHLDVVYEVASFIPLVSLIVRRLHDIELSGWWGWVFIIPAIGPVWLIYLLAKPGLLQYRSTMQ